MLKRIVILGPESTGKTTLCAALANHFGTSWVPEYAREHLTEQRSAYTEKDLLVIAQKQIEREDQLIQQWQQEKNESLSKQPIFIDTDLYVMKVWSEFVFNSCHPFILNGIVHRSYDLYLLCKPDLPWEKDALREYPDQNTRDRLYHHYKDAMVNQACPWKEIGGLNEHRIKQAIEAVHTLFK